MKGVERSALGLALLGVALGAWGCNGAEVPLKLKLVRVDREGIVIEATSAPQQTVKLGYKETKVTDAEGKALLRAEVPSSGELDYGLRDGRIDVQAVHTDLMQQIHDNIFGSKSAAYESMDLGFNPIRLRDIPEKPDGPWLRFAGWDGVLHSTGDCVTLRSELGSGKVGLRGGAFLGPPGARVKVAGDSFKIKKSGLGFWKPSKNTMFTLFKLGQKHTKATFEVTLKGKPPLQIEADLNLGRDCEAEAVRIITKAQQKKKPLPGGTGEQSPFMLIARQSNEVLAISRSYGTPVGLAMGDAKYVAIEVDGERGASSSCSKAVYYDATHDQIITISRTPIDSSFTIYELPGYKKVAEKSFKANDGLCESTVRVSDSDVTDWARGVLKEREPEPEVKPRSPARRATPRPARRPGRRR